jgi:hypothetical protein
LWFLIPCPPVETHWKFIRLWRIYPPLEDLSASGGFIRSQIHSDTGNRMGADNPLTLNNRGEQVCQPAKIVKLRRI